MRLSLSLRVKLVHLTLTQPSTYYCREPKLGILIFRSTIDIMRLVILATLLSTPKSLKVVALEQAMQPLSFSEVHQTYSVLVQLLALLEDQVGFSRETSSLSVTLIYITYQLSKSPHQRASNSKTL